MGHIIIIEFSLFVESSGCSDYFNLCYDHKINSNQASINYYLKDLEKISFEKKVNFIF